MKYVCVDCHAEYDWTDRRYRCECGGLLSLRYDKKPIDFRALETLRDRSLWRYQGALPPFDPQVISAVTMGEGGTPLVGIGPRVWGKADYLMPTLSFKDRGAVMLVCAMLQQGVRSCVIDSSGNAATSVSAYCTRVGIACEVFVPSYTSAKKVEQIEAHQATVHRIEHTREDTARAAIEFVESTGAFYASHIFNPLFWEGTKTYVYELYEQFGGRLPEVLVLPVGNGTLLMGAILALDELMGWNAITHYPLIIAVQAANCAPLAATFASGSAGVLTVETKPTLAEGIASAAPARGNEIIAAMRRVGGRFVTVSEREILEARDTLARRGLYVELTSAANHAGYLAAFGSSSMEEAVIPLCGAGLKSAH